MNEKIYESLTTPFYDEMNGNIPWNEYPRPTMRRDSFLCLNGEWELEISDVENIPTVFTEKVLVPFPLGSLLSGINRQIPEGRVAFFKKSFTVPDGFIKDRFILHFGAVDTLCTLYFNGVSVLSHEGGYLPFSADVTEYLREENEIILAVKNDMSGVYPYGKKKVKRGGMWYTPTFGIWQTVWAESVCGSAISKLKIKTDLSGAEIEYEGGDEGATLTLRDSGESFTAVGRRFLIEPSDKRTWSPESPYLYYFTISSGEDKVESYFALREIGIKSFNGVERLTLNGEAYLFNGLLDQGYYPDGIFLPATSRGYENDILTAKRLGFNTLRKHIKIEPEIFYHLCDRLGMVVFQDFVNNGKYSFFFDTALPTVFMKSFPDQILHRDKKTRRIFKEHAAATVEHLYSFPCVLYYTIFNEGWGQFSADENYEFIKGLDDTRIIDATSGWFKRKKSDVDSRHVYFKPVKVKGPSDRPIVISEFGGYSHRVKGHLFGSDNYGYKIFDDINEFRSAFKRLYGEEILPLISKGVSALIYTQVSDVEDETNGVMTYDRRVTKLDEGECYALMNSLYEKMKEVAIE